MHPLAKILRLTIEKIGGDRGLQLEKHLPIFREEPDTLPLERSAEIISDVIEFCLEFSKSNPGSDADFDDVGAALIEFLNSEEGRILCASESHPSKILKNSALELARSFSLFDASNLNPSANKLKQESVFEVEKEWLTDLSSKNIKTPQDFINHLKFLINFNDDELLKKFLSLKNDQNIKLTTQFLPQIADHAEILELATNAKLIKTFDMLLEAGFDPLKRRKGRINPFALACQTQGEVPLGAYLDSIRKHSKDSRGKPNGEKKVREVLAADRGALMHAIEGRGYVEVISLLKTEGMSLLSDMNYLNAAAANDRAGAFEALLGKPNEQMVDAISRRLPNETKYVFYFLLREKLEDKHSATAQNLQQKLDEKEQSMSEEDLFQICRLRGVVALNCFSERMNKKNGYLLAQHINDTDQNGNTPLYHAIDGLAYNSLVKALLALGADPNRIDAAALATKKKEPGTLKLLLESKKLSTESIESAHAEMKRGGDNTLIVRAFLEGLRDEDLGKLNHQIRFDLLQTALAKPELDHCLSKFAAVSRDLPIGDLLMNLIAEAKTEELSKLFQHVPVKSIITSLTRRAANVLEPVDQETPNNSISNGYGSKLSDAIDKKYLLTALTKAENDPSDERKAVITILLSNGFEGREFEQRLRKLTSIPARSSDACTIM